MRLEIVPSSREVCSPGWMVAASLWGDTSAFCSQAWVTSGQARLREL